MSEKVLLRYRAKYKNRLAQKHTSNLWRMDVHQMLMVRSILECDSEFLSTDYYLGHSRDELRAEVELLLADAKEDGTSIKVGSR